jgi:hypothetical protein
MLTVFLGSPVSIWRIKCAFARYASVLLCNVANDPPLYALPHEFEIDDDLTPFTMAVDGPRFTSKAGCRASIFDCDIGLDRTPRGRMSLAFSGRTPLRFHIDTVALIIPIRGFIDGLHLGQDEFIALEPEWAFPLHVGRTDHIGVR